MNRAATGEARRSWNIKEVNIAECSLGSAGELLQDDGEQCASETTYSGGGSDVATRLAVSGKRTEVQERTARDRDR